MRPNGGGCDDSDESDQRGTPTDIAHQLLQHDIRNHLLVIQGNVELLIDQLDDDHAVDYLQTIKSQTDAAFSLLQETKSMTNGARGAALEFGDVASSVEAELGQIEAAYPDANITVDFSGDLTVRTPPFFGSIVSNLLRNAIEHTSGESPRINVGVSVEEDTITFGVEDDGPGIPDEVLDNIANTACRDDDGMGLYIVHSLVEEYDGTLTFDTESYGTTVTIILPTNVEEEGIVPDTGTGPTEETPPVRQQISPDESIGTTVVRTVAAISDTRIENLDPLGSVIDPDALDSIFKNDESGCVEFQYYGHLVTVEPDCIRVEPTSSP